ncbi:MAG: SMP-30/gluconolactonase/LRE family protein [Parvularculaceae bacterium]
MTFADAVLVPADQSLARPEDGVALADGTLIVADQRYGLVEIAPDGAIRPFGNFAATGYAHAPPETIAGPNGVSLEPDGAHILVADIFTGAIYRTDIETETTERIYQHAFGVNNAVADSTGAIWFTQSTENGGADAAQKLFAAIDVVIPDGALYRMVPGGEPEMKLGGLEFANGFVIDEARGALYIAETMGDRVVAFDLNLATGDLSGRKVLASVMTPDNVEMDGAGRLWIASPIGNEIVVVDPESGERQIAFQAKNADSDRVAAEWRRRAEAGEGRIELFSPATWAPLPGGITGVILPPVVNGRLQGPVYVSGLGGALIKLDMAGR